MTDELHGGRPFDIRRRTPEELRAYFQGHTAGYDMGRRDQKREDDEVIAVLYGRFDPPKNATGAE